MQWKIPKNTKEFLWTQHVINKMRQYGLSEQKVRSVIFRHTRKEEGIAPRTIAVMQRAGSKKKPTELWVMYVVQNSFSTGRSFRPASKISLRANPHSSRHRAEYHARLDLRGPSKKNSSLGGPKVKKIISAWKYPGMSPKRNPIPEDILRELSSLT